MIQLNNLFQAIDKLINDESNNFKLTIMNNIQPITINKPVTLMRTVVILSFLCGSFAAAGQNGSNAKNSGSLQLAQTTVSSQEPAKTLIETGDELRLQGDYEGAIASYREAEKAGKGGDALTRTIAETYLDMGNEKEAYWEYRKLANSTNQEIAKEVCEQSEWLRYSRYKSLPDPYFADLYTNVGWQSIGDVAYIDAKARFGARAGDLEYYLFGQYLRDNRSGVAGEFPVEYLDNLGILGVGLQTPLVGGLSFITEASWVRELEDFDRDKEREDYMAGFEYYHSWNTERGCDIEDITPNRFILSVGSELKYYSRYDDDWFFEVDVRPGIRLIESRSSILDSYVKFFHSQNLSENENSFSEVGVGLTWWPSRQTDFSIDVSANETYFDSGDSDSNIVIEFTYYTGW